MITGVRSASVYVRDQDAALRFYTETPGFELVQDTPMGEGAPRWIEVMPPDRQTLLVLFTAPGQEDRIGTFSNLLFACDDVRKTHEELVARGVTFAEDPTEQFWGWWAVFQDPDGNSYGLGQRGG
ncbi:MAG: VOC family protein [Actinomycetota bacterium]|nr:VOC family protein [Actinomycetota bacterium]